MATLVADFPEILRWYDGLSQLPAWLARLGGKRLTQRRPGSRREPSSRRLVTFYNVWRPLYRRVEELLLAMCDSTTHIPEDMLVMDLKYRERIGEIYVIRHAPQYRWCNFPRMEADQALLLKTYDSETDGRARFRGHTSFEDPQTLPDAQKRESIEVRTMAFC